MLCPTAFSETIFTLESLGHNRHQETFVEQKWPKKLLKIVKNICPVPTS
jgi:hypothetical protein